MASADLREEVNCFICLGIYTDPVTLPCGHNFCQGCIGRVLDAQEGSWGYTCPECRAEFPQRPPLQSNRKLQNITERFVSAHTEHGETGILCTYCDSPVPAVKSCLQCESSLCDRHLVMHSKSLEHVLIEPMASLGNRKCVIHNKILEYYCCEDAACVCVSCCLVGTHRDHKMEALNDASGKKKEKLRNVVEKLTPKREETEKQVQNLQEHRREIQGKAADDKQRITALFRDIREQLKALEKRVLSKICRQEKRLSLQLTDLIQQLEIKKEELSRKIHHIEELCNMADPLTVLQEQESDGFCGSQWGNIKRRKTEDMMAFAVQEVDLISLTLLSGLHGIVTGAKSRIHGQWATDLLLDVKTANKIVAVSGDLKTATCSEIRQHYPKTPVRFKYYPQVLSTGSFSSGRHYWEVETSESGQWGVGVAYPSIEREGKASWIRNNNKSWTLFRHTKGFSVGHDAVFTAVSPESKIFGILLDFEAGHLSFYELSNPVRHLHTFTVTFTEPLHAAFWVHDKAWVRICSL